MLQRKINAGLALISTLLLMGHAILHAVWMLSRGRIAINAGFMPWILVGTMLAHVFISIDLAISAHTNSQKRKCNNYPAMNVSTMIQRVSGILLIIFTGLHIAGTMGITQTPPMVHAIVPPLFFTLTLAHVAVSTSKAFITLGIGDAAFVRRVDVVTKVICVATLLADVIGFYLFVV